MLFESSPFAKCRAVARVPRVSAIRGLWPIIEYIKRRDAADTHTRETRARAWGDIPGT